MARCDLEQLFGKTDSGRIPRPGRRPGPSLTERRARRIITIIALLSLLLLAVGIFTQLLGSYRYSSQMQRQQFVALLRLAAHGLSAAVRDADTVRAPMADDIRRVLPDFAFDNGRHFIIVDADGRVRTIASAERERPAASFAHLGELLPQPLRRLVLAADGTAKVQYIRLPGGPEILVGAMPIGAWPGTVLLAQRASPAATHAQAHTFLLLSLFIGVFVVMVGLVAIYNWQSRRGEEEGNQLADFILRLETALQLGRCGLWDWDISRGRIYLSPSMRQLLGMPPMDGYMDLKDFLALQHPTETPIDQLLEENLGLGVRTFEHELRLRHTDNRWVWVKMRGALPERQYDQIQHLVGIAVDITEQKLANDAMRNAEQRLTQAIESISESFALWDERMRLVACNSKFREFFGLPAGVCQTGETLDEVMRQATNPARKRVAPRTLDDGTQQETIAELELADGRWLQISERSLPEGGFVSVGTDISELKRKQMELENSRRELEKMVEALERSQQEIRHKNDHLNMLARRYQREKERAEEALRIKSRFLANVSHELFTPLNHIIGSADAMRNELLGELSDTYREYAERILSAGQEINRKIQDMLDFAQLSTENDDINTHTTDIGSLVAEVGERFVEEAERKGIRLSWRAPRDLKAVLDAHLLRKALMQLVSNAVRFTDEGEVYIGADMDENGQLIFEVRDTGIGIPAEKIARIGQPFERPGNAYNSHSGGSGIGLAFAKIVAEKHGGRMEIESEEGAGTRVRLYIPNSKIIAARPPARNNALAEERADILEQTQPFDDE